MKVVKLHRIKSLKQPNLWSFNLSLNGFIINGFIFNADTGSVLTPKGAHNRSVVRCFGAQMNTLRTLVKQALVDIVDIEHV